MTTGMYLTVRLVLAVSLVAAQVLAHPQEITPDELAGTYVFGFAFGSSTLRLKSDGVYSIESSDCTTIYSESGTYLLSGGVLRLKASKRTEREPGDDKEADVLVGLEERRLVPVRWSYRMYLIYESDLESFAEAVERGVEPRSELTSMSNSYDGAFYLRRGDELKPVSGRPALPAK